MQITLTGSTGDDHASKNHDETGGRSETDANRGNKKQTQRLLCFVQVRLICSWFFLVWKFMPNVELS